MYCMGQILLSLKTETEQKLRRLAKELKGGKKGALSETVEEALDLLAKEAKRRMAWKRAWELSDRHQDLGIGTFKREDAYTGKRFERLMKQVNDSNSE